MTFKPCNKGCNINIELRRVDQKWIPFEESGNKHDCPNSEYNKKRMPTHPDPIKSHLMELSEQEASHDEPQVIEVQEKPTYPQHRVAIVHGNIDEIQDKINAVLEYNDSKGCNHRGVSMLPSLEENVAWYTAVIHYEILMPPEERKKRLGGEVNGR